MPSITNNIFDIRMNDGSRYFANFPESVFFDKLHEHSKTLPSVEVTGFITDWITQIWLDFEYRKHKFSINNQMGDYWFFVKNPDCPEEILLEILEHFETLLEK